MCENYPEILDDGIEESPSYMQHLVEKLKITTQPVFVSEHDAASLLMGKCNLSQRAYKNLRKVLQSRNVNLPRYETVVAYIKNINTGKVIKVDDQCDNCMCASTSLQDTLQKIMDSELYCLTSFLDVPQQRHFLKHLKERDSDLYSSLQIERRTLFLRQTGDNFRAAARYPTEQVSFSVLNMMKMVNSPHGQFINCLWRGSESREGLLLHLSAYLADLENVVKNGIQLSVNGVLETFNVVVFVCTDLGFMEKLLGKCSTTSMFGCFWCSKQLKSWSDDRHDIAKPQTIREMVNNGEKALKELGNNPSRTSAKFVKFQQSHKGQYVSITIICNIQLKGGIF